MARPAGGSYEAARAMDGPRPPVDRTSGTDGLADRRWIAGPRRPNASNATTKDVQNASNATTPTPERHRERRVEEKESSVSRVLFAASRATAIPLGDTSPYRSSDLPGRSAGHANASLFGLAPSGVCRAAECCHRRGALLPHRFTLAVIGTLRRAMLGRSAFCCTFRRLTPPRRYLALCPVEPGLSSMPRGSATVWTTPGRIVAGGKGDGLN